MLIGLRRRPLRWPLGLRVDMAQCLRLFLLCALSIAPRTEKKITPPSPNMTQNPSRKLMLSRLIARVIGKSYRRRGLFKSRALDAYVFPREPLCYAASALSSMFLTDIACHWPPRAVATPLALSASAIWRNVVAPAL